MFGDPLELEEEEKFQVKRFNEYLQLNELFVPEQYGDKEKLRYLQAVNYKHAKAHEAILNHDAFVQYKLPPKVDGLEKYHDEGMFYILNRDRAFRPIIVIDMKKLLGLKIDDEAIIQYTIMMMEYLVEKALVPGKVENWFVLIDCANMGLTKLPRKKISRFTKTMRTAYSGRLYRIVMINVNFFVKAILKVVNAFIDPFTAKKMTTFGKKDYPAYLEYYIDPEKLEEKFGGKLPNKTSDYFPPTLD